MSIKTVSAIYSNPTSAKIAIDLLRANGFKDGELSILASESSIEKNIEIEENTKAPEGISLGASVGGAVGATIAGLTAIGTVTLTGGASLLAAGPIVASLAGAGAGATAGGVIGGLIGMGIPETEAKIINERLGSGNVLIGINTSDQQKNETKKLLERSGAEQVTVH